MKNAVKKNKTFGFSVKVRKDLPRAALSGRLIRIIGRDEGGKGDLGRVTSVEFL
jgi:ribonuclease HIII